MKWLFLTILFFCAGGTLLTAQELPYDPNEYIEWNEYHKLTWDMFTGEPDPSSIGDAGTAVKIQALPFLVDKKIHYHVHALFSKKSSWCREDRSPELLAHEQLHFDIAELTARKVRKKIAELKKVKEKDLGVYNEAIEKILHDSNAFDARYDRETYHGILSDQQEAWQKNITRDLKRLHNYRGHQKRTL